MDNLDLYRQAFSTYKDLCSSGRQPSAFHAYVREQGLDPRVMKRIMEDEYPSEEVPLGRNQMGKVYSSVYADFRDLCAEGKQPGSFASYCRERGVTYKRVHWYMKDHRLQVMNLPGYTKPTGCNKGYRRYQEVPFEDIIFEEAGFLPADDRKVISVQVDGHTCVSFPADTDIDVVVRFVKQLGKEADHVGS